MNRRPLFAFTVTILGTALLLPPAAAQVRGGSFGGARAPRTGGSVRGGGRTSLGSRGRGQGQYGFGFFPGWGWAYLPPYYPDYDYGYDYDNGYGPEAAQAPPPWYVMHPEQPAAPAKPVEPLVLERQGDQWVRISASGQPPASAPAVNPGSAQAPGSASPAGDRNNAAPPPPKLPPALLVFHDGHQEEIDKYTIIGSVIYARGDYWKTGSWTRKVAIADLDIPATLKLNRERGGKFSLPSGPNEVVVRP
jgi:hypothetical protein